MPRISRHIPDTLPAYRRPRWTPSATRRRFPSHHAECDKALALRATARLWLSRTPALSSNQLREILPYSLTRWYWRWPNVTNPVPPPPRYHVQVQMKDGLRSSAPG
jgi:hypothetical protein